MKRTNEISLFSVTPHAPPLFPKSESQNNGARRDAGCYATARLTHSRCNGYSRNSRINLERGVLYAVRVVSNP
jgi:hypothetical protein